MQTTNPQHPLENGTRCAHCGCFSLPTRYHIPDLQPGDTLVCHNMQCRMLTIYVQSEPPPPIKEYAVNVIIARESCVMVNARDLASAIVIAQHKTQKRYPDAKVSVTNTEARLPHDWQNYN